MKKTLFVICCFALVLALLFGLSLLKERLMPEEETAAVEENIAVDWANELDEAHAVSIVMDGDTISALGQGVAVVGSTVTIRYPGTYVLSGGLHDGQILVDCDHDGTVYLVLDSAQIHCYTGPAIFVKQAQETVLVLPEGSQSYVSDGSSYALVYASDGTEDPDQPDAAIFSRDNLRVEGSGTLTVTGYFRDAIHGKDDLVFSGGSLILCAVNDGAKGTESLTVEGGALTVYAQGDGLQSTKGPVEVLDGTVTIQCGGDGLAALTDLTVSGGSIAVTAAGGWQCYSDIVVADVSAKGLKADRLFLLGGQITLDTADDGLHAEQQLLMEAGRVTVASGDDGISAGSLIDIRGGELTVAESYEGLEALRIALSGGSVRVTAENNGLAATLDVLETERTAEDCAIVISGGALNVTAEQGVKTDGSFLVQEGAVFIQGLSAEDDAVEAGLGSTLQGGTLLICGILNSDVPMQEETSYSSILHRLASPAAAGTAVELRNEDGEVFFTYTPEGGYSAVYVACNALIAGESCQLVVGSETASVVLGEAETAAASAEMGASGAMGGMAFGGPMF